MSIPDYIVLPALDAPGACPQINSTRRIGNKLSGEGALALFVRPLE